MNDRERLIELIDSVAVMRLSEVRELADYLIANGVTVQKHGVWGFLNDYTARCSNCGEDTLIDWEDEPKFCPNRGAKMCLEDKA